MSRWILIAEDERQLGEMLCDNLSLEAYHTEHVLTGPSALERMQKGGIDLLVLDVMLPGMDGFEVLKELRARGDKTPVLILSARADDQDRIRGLELQADDYLTKPFNLRELLLRVDALRAEAFATKNAVVDVLHGSAPQLRVSLHGRHEVAHRLAPPAVAILRRMWTSNVRV